MIAFTIVLITYAILIVYLVASERQVRDARRTIHNQAVWITAQSQMLAQYQRENRAVTKGMLAFFPDSPADICLHPTAAVQEYKEGTMICTRCNLINPPAAGKPEGWDA